MRKGIEGTLGYLCATGCTRGDEEVGAGAETATTGVGASTAGAGTATGTSSAWPSASGVRGPSNQLAIVWTQAERESIVGAAKKTASADSDVFMEQGHTSPLVLVTRSSII